METSARLERQAFGPAHGRGNHAWAASLDLHSPIPEQPVASDLGAPKDRGCPSSASTTSARVSSSAGRTSANPPDGPEVEVSGPCARTGRRYPFQHNQTARGPLRAPFGKCMGAIGPDPRLPKGDDSHSCFIRSSDTFVGGGGPRYTRR